IGHDGPPGERGATPFSWVSAPRITASNASEPRRFPARDRRTPNEDACSVYFGPRGSIGVVPRTPRISSSTLAPASNCASPRGGPTTCSPTGKPEAVNPQGSDSAGQHTSVIA